MVFLMYIWKNEAPFLWSSTFNPFGDNGWAMIPLWVNRFRKNCCLYSGIYPQYLVADYYYLVDFKRATEDSMLSLIFDRSALVWVREKLVVVDLGGGLGWRTIDVGKFGALLLTWISDKMNMCAWWRFVLAVGRNKLDGL